jgi:hypothetical protein
VKAWRIPGCIIARPRYILEHPLRYLLALLRVFIFPSLCPDGAGKHDDVSHRPLFQNTTLIAIYYHLLLFVDAPYTEKQHYDILERRDILPIFALTFGSLGGWVNRVAVTLLYAGSVVGALLLGPFFFPPLPEPGAAQAHLLCGSQVQMALLLAQEMPRFLFAISFRYPAPVTISERKSLLCKSSNVQYRLLFTYKGKLP